MVQFILKTSEVIPKGGLHMKSVKILCVAMAGLFLMTALCACNANTSVSSVSETTAESVTGTEKPATTETETTTTETEKPSETETTAPKFVVHKSSEIRVLGRLYQLENAETPTISAVTIKAIPTGNTQDINSLPPASDGIRCIFDLDSFITINPTCPFDYDLKITIVPHQAKASYYDKNFLKKKAKKYLKQELCNDNIGYATAAFSLERSRFKTGYYDIVFLRGSMPIAVMMIKIYGNGGIKKTKKDPVELMKNEIEKSKTAKATTKKKSKKKK